MIAPFPAPPMSTEEYGVVRETGFQNASRSPLSTFSIDVDTASYANVRRYLTGGGLPPKDAVRIEELVNYFSYDYPDASGTDPFAVHAEVAACPWNPNHRLVAIGLQGKRIDTTDLPASNLVFLVDVSGSMSSPDKLPLLKQSLRLLVDELRPQDRVAIVAYAGASGLVLGPTPGNRKDRILEALERLESGGSTAGAAGIQLAYKVAEEHFARGGNNRVILATDGDFNVGVTSEGELEALIEQKRKSGVYLSVLGFGTGNIKDNKMSVLAEKGNGNYAYIDSLLEARKVLVRQMGGTLLTIAKDVKLQVELNPARVKSYRLVGYESRMLKAEDFRDDRKDAGEMGAGHTVTALYEIVPVGSPDAAPGVDPLKYQRSEVTESARASSELMTVKARYKPPQASASRPIEVVVRDGGGDLRGASENFRFAAAVAEWGMLLRDSEYKGTADIGQVLDLAKAARGEDEGGLRAEFIRLVELSRSLLQSSTRER
jgi:Ca-activated chloride channel family protein